MPSGCIFNAYFLDQICNTTLNIFKMNHTHFGIYFGLIFLVKYFKKSTEITVLKCNIKITGHFFKFAKTSVLSGFPFFKIYSKCSRHISQKGILRLNKPFNNCVAGEAFLVSILKRTNDLVLQFHFSRNSSLESRGVLELSEHNAITGASRSTCTSHTSDKKCALCTRI